MMHTKILVPLDGSRLSEGVLPYVRTLARGINVPVELLCVADTSQLTRRPSTMRDAEYFERVKASFSGVADITHTLESGNPAGIIVDSAAAHPGTLIAMAAHGDSGGQRWLLGSVTQKVLHAAKNDLLIVRPAEGQSSDQASLRTLLVPLDGSEGAEKVLPTASALANCFESEVVLLHVLVRFYVPLPEAVVPVFGMNMPDQKDLWAQARTKATEYLNRKVEQLRAGGLAHVSSVLIDGGAEGAAADIVDQAAKIPEHLVVMSTHGRSGLGRWLLGSVVERVVRHSSGAVLVIRPKNLA